MIVLDDEEDTFENDMNGARGGESNVGEEGATSIVGREGRENRTSRGSGSTDV